MSRISIVQVQVEALLFLEDILQNGHRIITCEIFEVAMRDGYRAIAERTNLNDLANEGCYLLDHGADEAFADWLDPDRPFDAACRLFATVARQQGENTVGRATRLAGFYARQSAPARIMHTHYAAAMSEIPKFAPDILVRNVVVSPLSSRLQ